VGKSKPEKSKAEDKKEVTTTPRAKADELRDDQARTAPAPRITPDKVKGEQLHDDQADDRLTEARRPEYGIRHCPRQWTGPACQT